MPSGVFTEGLVGIDSGEKKFNLVIHYPQQLTPCDA